MTSRTSGTATRLDDLAGAYTFVARLLLEPADAALLSRVGESDLMDDWPLRDETSLAGARQLRAGAAEGPRPLVEDFQQLFVGPGHLAAPPYESAYRSRDHLLFDTATMEVRRAYEESGLVAPALNREPDDHMGLELQLLGYLCLQALDALADRDDDALATALRRHDDFVERHLGVWAEEFLARVRDGARTTFYRAVADLGSGLVTQARIPLAT
ncbi:TorD/DmsD family molecular chaperone [Nocardioides pacificus]